MSGDYPIQIYRPDGDVRSTRSTFGASGRHACRMPHRGARQRQAKRRLRHDPRRLGTWPNASVRRWRWSSRRGPAVGRPTPPSRARPTCSQSRGRGRHRDHRCSRLRVLQCLQRERHHPARAGRRAHRRRHHHSLRALWWTRWRPTGGCPRYASSCSTTRSVAPIDSHSKPRAGDAVDQLVQLLRGGRRSWQTPDRAGPGGDDDRHRAPASAGGGGRRRSPRSKASTTPPRPCGSG